MRAQLFEITHISLYQYSLPVSISHNLFRLTPRRLPRQHTLSHSLQIGPIPSTTQVRTDYFNNEVTFATIAETHQELRILARSQIAISPIHRLDPS